MGKTGSFNWVVAGVGEANAEGEGGKKADNTKYV